MSPMVLFCEIVRTQETAFLLQMLFFDFITLCLASMVLNFTITGLCVSCERFGSLCIACMFSDDTVTRELVFIAPVAMKVTQSGTQNVLQKDNNAGNVKVITILSRCVKQSSLIRNLLTGNIKEAEYTLIGCVILPLKLPGTNIVKADRKYTTREGDYGVVIKSRKT